MKALLKRMFWAHVMAVVGRSDQGVLKPDGKHWQMQGLAVFDATLIPTPLGAPRQWPVYGLSARMATALVMLVTGRPVRQA